jgi:predicted NUDIX family NTP pyrophosphohydrolase
MQIVKQIQRTGLLKKCSLERLFLELEKIRWFVLPDEKFLITEIGKKQRGILDSLNISSDVRNYVSP